MAATNPLIKVENVTKSFQLAAGPIKVLEDINLEIKPNSFTIIYGPSGSGKTTLLNILSGLEPPTSGEVIVDGKRIYSYSGEERAYFRSQSLGIVYQAEYWVKSLTVLENVAMPLYVAGYDMPEANERALASLKEISMDEFAHHMPTVLSGGQQQRVAMARALVADPEIIMADEPTGNLDTKNGDMIMDLLKSIQAKGGRTIILITHNLDYLPMSDNQIHIQDGHVLTGKPKKRGSA